MASDGDPYGGLVNPFADQSKASAFGDLVNPFDPSAKPKPAPETAPISDTLKQVAGGAVSGVGEIGSGIGELGRRAAVPIVAGANMLGARLSDPVNAFEDNALQRAGAAISDSATPEYKRQMQATSITDPSTWTPSGVAGNVAQAAGGLAPFLAAQFIPGVNATADEAAAAKLLGTAGEEALAKTVARRQLASGAGVFAASSGGAAMQQARDQIGAMSDDDISKVPGYASRIAAGQTPEQARGGLSDDAARGVFLPAAGVGALGGLVLGGPLSHSVQKAAAEAIGGGLTRKLLVGATTDAALMGGQNVAQNAAQIASMNAVTGQNKDPLEGAGSAFLSGAVMGGAFGGYGGLAAHRGEAFQQAVEALKTKQAAEDHTAAIATPEGRAAYADTLRTAVDAATTPEAKASALGALQSFTDNPDNQQALPRPNGWIVSPAGDMVRGDLPSDQVQTFEKPAPPLPGGHGMDQQAPLFERGQPYPDAPAGSLSDVANVLPGAHIDAARADSAPTTSTADKAPQVQPADSAKGEPPAPPPPPPADISTPQARSDAQAAAIAAGPDNPDPIRAYIHATALEGSAPSVDEMVKLYGLTARDASAMRNEAMREVKNPTPEVKPDEQPVEPARAVAAEAGPAAVEPVGGVRPAEAGAADGARPDGEPIKGDAGEASAAAAGAGDKAAAAVPTPAAGSEGQGGKPADAAAAAKGPDATEKPVPAAAAVAPAQVAPHAEALAQLNDGQPVAGALGHLSKAHLRTVAKATGNEFTGQTSRKEIVKSLLHGSENAARARLIDAFEKIVPEDQRLEKPATEAPARAQPTQEARTPLQDTKGRGLTMEEFHNAIAPMRAALGRNGPEVVAHADGETLPEHLRNDRDEQGNLTNAHLTAEGAYDAGTAHFIPSNIKAGYDTVLKRKVSAEERARMVFAHEVVGHHGIEHIVEKSGGAGTWQKISDGIDAMRSNPKYADLFKELDERGYVGSNKPLNTREAVAVMAEKGLQNGVMDRVHAAMRKFLRSIGLVHSINDADIKEYIAQASRYVKDGQAGDGVRPRDGRMFSLPPGDGDSREYGRGGAVNEGRQYASGDRAGQIVGAPEKYNTPEKLVGLHNLFRSLAQEGVRGKLWYEHSGEAILRATGGDKEEARKLAGLLAIFSPKANVSGNTTMAMRAWAQFKAGEPIHAATGVQNRKAEAWLRTGKLWDTGEKTGNFFQNVMRVIDTDKHGAHKQGVTVDMWMMRAAGFRTDAPNPAGYRFVENETNRLAKELGWEPQQVQAAIWTAMKARTENKGVKAATIAESIKGGFARMAEKVGGKEGLQVLNSVEHHDLWMRKALEHAPTDEDLNSAKYDYGHALAERSIQTSWEATPSVTSGILPGIHNATPEQQHEYLKAKQDILAPNGKDVLAEMAGLPSGTTVFGHSAYEGKVGAGAQTTAPISWDARKSTPEEIKNGAPPTGRHLSELSKTAADLAARMRGYVLNQDAVAYGVPIYNEAIKYRNAVQLDIGRPLTLDETSRLYDALRQKFGTDNIAPAYTETGARIGNYQEVDNKTFQSGMREVVADFAKTIPEDVKHGFYRSEGNYLSNDYKANPDGQGYRSAIQAERPDVLGRLDLLKGQLEEVDKRFAAKYGWDKAGSASAPDAVSGIGGDAKSDAGGNRFSRAMAPEQDREQLGQSAGWHDRPVQRDAVGVTGVHYSNTEGLKALDGRKYGSNHKGAEFARIDNAIYMGGNKYKPLLNRVYFYPSDSKLAARGESVVGRAATHQMRLSNMYDANKDPRGIFDKARTPSDAELAVIKAGYDGYRTKDMAVALDTRPIKTTGDHVVEQKQALFSRPADQEEMKTHRDADGAVTAYERDGHRIPASEKLTPDERRIEARAAAQVLADPAKALADYEALGGDHDTEGGRVISTDLAREIFPDYNSGPQGRTSYAFAVHEPASYVAKMEWQKRLAMPVSDDKAPRVLFLAGGTGAGKTTAVRRNPELQHLRDSADIIYDGNLQNVKSAEAKFREAHATNRDVRVLYINRDPLVAFSEGAIPRANRDNYGRTVPVPAHASTHIGAARAFLELRSKWDGKPGFSGFDVVDNPQAGSVGPHHTVESVAAMQHNVLEERVQNEIDRLHAEGKLKPRVAAYYRPEGGPEGVRAQPAEAGKGASGRLVGAGPPERLGDRAGQSGSGQEQGQVTTPRGLFSRTATADDIKDGDRVDPRAKPTSPRAPGESKEAYARRLSGANAADIKAGMAAASKQQMVARGDIREMLANLQRSLGIADRAFKSQSKLLDVRSDEENLKSINQWENGKAVSDPVAAEFFNALKGEFAQRVETIRSLAPGALQDLIDNYFPHMYKDPIQAAKVYSAAARNPLAGSKDFMKQRFHDTLADGIKAGLEPLSYNPVDVALLRLGQMDKFIAFSQFKKQLEARGWIAHMGDDDRVPLGYARVKDPSFNKAAVPELIARDINNYLEPGLYKYGAWRKMRTVQNLMLSARLGLSAFHAGFTTIDTGVSHLDVALRKALQGDIGGSLGMLAKGAVSPIMAPMEGRKLLKQFYGQAAADPQTTAILDALTKGGARGMMDPTDVNDSLAQFGKAWRQGDKAKAATHVIGATMEATSRWITHHLVPYQKMASRVMLAKFELDARAQELGQRKGDYAGITNAMHPDTLKQIMGKVVQNVDDRLGQLAYDNLFMNRIAKDISQASIQAVGWNIGTFNTIFGGISDARRLFKPEDLLAPLDKEGRITDGKMARVTGRLSYMIALNMGVGLLGAFTQQMLTGQPPQELKDYFFPKTGRKNGDGSDERISFPGYLKDEYSLATHPIATVEHKLHPSIATVAELLNNEDFYGTQVRDPNDKWTAQAGEIATHIAKSFEPYAVQGSIKNAQAGNSGVMSALPFVGITPAPASIARSPFQEMLAEKAADSAPQGARTLAQAQTSNALHDAERQIRLGEKPDLSQFTPEQRKAIMRAAISNVPVIRFKKLSLIDKLNAFDAASPEEREKYKLASLIRQGHWQRDIEELPAGDREDMRARVRAIMGQ